MYVQYDPTKHKDKPLFEEVTMEVDDGIAFVVRPSDASHEIAELTPWYYFVEEAIVTVKSTIPMNVSIVGG